MAKEIRMKLWRDDYTGPACLEYSWVPEGKRHVIRLAAGEQTRTVVDTIGDTTDPSHVQVYCLVNNKKVSTANWQFPPGPPASSPVVAASVHVYQKEFKAVGEVHYLVGTPKKDDRPLDDFPRPCPESPGEDKRQSS
jgi:hypothetical protein